MKATEAAYLAGLIDGEGCIYVAKDLMRRGGNYRYRIRLQVSNTNHDMIDWCLLVVGRGCVATPKRTSKRWKRLYSWVVYNPADVLEAVLPYLIIKKKQASLALSFIRKQTSGPVVKVQMGRLNKKGYKYKEVACAI